MKICGDQTFHVFSNQLIARIAEKLFRCRVLQNDAAFTIHLDDGVWRSLQQFSEPAFGLGKLMCFSFSSFQCKLLHLCVPARSEVRNEEDNPLSRPIFPLPRSHSDANFQ